jgi:hypothetical protein
MGNKSRLAWGAIAPGSWVRSHRTLWKVEWRIAFIALIIFGILPVSAHTQSTQRDSALPPLHLPQSHASPAKICDEPASVDQKQLSLDTHRPRADQSQVSSADRDPLREDASQDGRPAGRPTEAVSDQQAPMCEKGVPSQTSEQGTALSQSEGTTRMTTPSGPTVTYADGVVTIDPHGASLRQVLEAVRARAGFTLDLPFTGMNTRVFDDRIGPVSLREALIQLLYGSGFNYIIQNASTEPRDVTRISVSVRSAESGKEAAAVPRKPSDGETEEPALYGGFVDPSQHEQTPLVAATPPPPSSTPATNVPGVPSGFNLQQAAAEAHKTPGEILDDLQKRQIEILDSAAPPPP